MVLSVRVLSDVTSVNSYEYVDRGSWTKGDTTTLYIQLIDATKDRAERGFVPAGRRYCPASGATLTVTIDSLDSAKKITNRVATQPYPTLDPSIWAVAITSADTIQGTCAIRVTLTQSGVVTKGSKEAAIDIYPYEAV